MGTDFLDVVTIVVFVTFLAWYMVNNVLPFLS